MIFTELFSDDFGFCEAERSECDFVKHFCKWFLPISPFIQLPGRYLITARERERALFGITHTLAKGFSLFCAKSEVLR